MNTPGLATLLRIQWQTQWRSLLAWVGALAAGLIGTASAVTSLYDTPAKIHTYAASMTSGDALMAINGRVEGIDSLGGIIQNELGIFATFLMPLLGISLVVRSTRRDEESGRLETMLGGRIARHVPPLAALIEAGAAILLTTVVFSAGLVAGGVPARGSVLYAASLGALAFTFAGFAALLAQVTLHARDVYGWSLVVLAVGYVLRGVGDVTGTWITWLSPLGWAEKTAPFGPGRWWVLLIPMLVGAVTATAAVRLAARRDLGSALLRGGTGPAHASRQLHTATGLALWIHRPALIGWLAGAVLLAAMMGSLSQQFLDAMAGNPAMAEAIGIIGGRPEDGFLAVTHLYLAVIGAGYVVQSVATLHTEESTGRLEPRLAGTLSRRGWLTAHVMAILVGLTVVVLVSSLVLGVTTAWSMGDAAVLGSILGTGLAYLPAELVFAGLALALFGLRPRLLPLAWAAYAVTATIALLGPSLQLPGWALDLAPTTHVGNPPMGDIEGRPLFVLTTVAVGLVTVAVLGFRHRGIPQS